MGVYLNVFVRKYVNKEFLMFKPLTMGVGTDSLSSSSVGMFT